MDRSNYLLHSLSTGGHISGANYNPAVSFALAIRGLLSWRDAICYCIVQLIASVAAGGTGLLIMLKAVRDEEGDGAKVSSLRRRLQLSLALFSGT